MSKSGALRSESFQSFNISKERFDEDMTQMEDSRGQASPAKYLGHMMAGTLLKERDKESEVQPRTM